MGRSGGKWKNKEIDLLCFLFKKGMSRIDIAKRFNNRDAKSVTSKLSKLGLLNTNKMDYVRKTPLSGSSKLDLIMEVVCDYFKINKNTLSSLSRKIEILRPRQYCHKLAIEMTNFSLSTIGKNIGRKDHTTVLHSKKVINNLIDTDNEVRLTYAKLKKAYYLRNKKSDKHIVKIDDLIKKTKVNLKDINSKIVFNQLIKELNGT